MEKFLRIGQVSNLYGISLDTLRYYDRKGLLTPMVDQQNGYRYYSLEHLDTLEMILVGKYLEIPLERIKEKIDSESISGYQDMLQEQIQFIEAKRDDLTKLIQYTTRMTTMLYQIEAHKNDSYFTSITSEKNMKVNIYKVELSHFLNTQKTSTLTGIEAFEQWIFYEVKEDGEVKENAQTIGLSIQSDIALENELIEYLEHAVSQGTVEKYSLPGSCQHISFWGNENELLEYLHQLCRHFKLRNTTLSIKFQFALLHKGKKHEYWSDIYFSPI